MHAFSFIVCVKFAGMPDRQALSYGLIKINMSWMSLPLIATYLISISQSRVQFWFANFLAVISLWLDNMLNERIAFIFIYCIY